MTIDYCCPICRGALTLGECNFTCNTCLKTFSFSGGIPNLDYLQSTESLVFDKMYQSQEHLSESDLDSAKKNAVNLFNHMWKEPVRGLEILEIAAGRGELTAGLFTSPLIKDSNFYCFDHSIQSMQILVNSLTNMRNETTNILYPSIQDVNSMAFKEPCFDLV